MKLYSENKNYKLYHGSMLDMLEHIEPNSIDSVVTDPPYELNFMGSGTTAKVALLNNCQFIGFEVSKEYCEIANKRIYPILVDKNNELW